MTVQLTPTITMWTRREWGARQPSGPIPAEPNPHHGFLHHTTDPTAESMDTLAEMKAVMRGIQRFHMDTRGYYDIAYNYLVFQAYGARDFARVFQGRIGRPAAQADFNKDTLAIAVIGNFQNDDHVKPNTRHAIEVLLRRHSSLVDLGGHRDAPGQSTTCPGDTLEAWVPRIAKASGLHVRTRHSITGR